MEIDALKTYLETQKNKCKILAVPNNTCFEEDVIISVFIEDNKVMYCSECNGYLFQDKIDNWNANEIINHLLETENIYIPVDD